MKLDDFMARGQRAQAAVDKLLAPLPSPYARALEFVELHPGTSSARGMAMLLLSLWNGEDCGFSFRECIVSFDVDRQALALAVICHFVAVGEDRELVDVGHRVYGLYRSLWEIGVEARDAKAALRAKWDAEYEAKLKREEREAEEAARRRGEL